MPIYQYDCGDCGRRVEILVRSIARAGDPVCPACGGRSLTRVVSQVARVRRAGDRIESIDVKQELGRLESNDVRGFERWARQMSSRYDDELGADFGQLAERAAAGDDPVERADVAFTLQNRVRRAKERLSEGSGVGDDV